ncbi:protein phosphatase 2C domain-containing protein [Luteolibacter ambystomatis]|uniref:Protein phosphatase 2C domain-containing protein n=1 Tax=Luteolibacter ambystomatis TaxID=2824561 RepID=A0A975J073_9BACT|nr:bifunctional protein-serine/threonine kinase/phosphatase [Luteolibacter ambystomatis]QUE51604.1 protein phosphatase 2C domain-containing protein [Luteolibacter ambystomatis]
MKVRHTLCALPRDPDGPSSDAVSWTAWDDGFLAVLADGAGTGAPAREAAQHAVSQIATHYRTHPLGWTPGKALRETVRLVNRTLWNESNARFERAEMISTLVVALYDEGTLHVLGIGDSRIYLLRQGQLDQLTSDDIDALLPLKLTKALGAEEALDVFTSRHAIEPDDVIFLCSDGVHHHLTATELHAKLAAGSAARAIATDARDASPAESRDDCAAIRIDVISLGWTAKRHEGQLPVPTKLITSQKIDGWTLVRSFGANDRCWLAEREGCRQVMKFAPTEAERDPVIAQGFLKETWNAIRFSEDPAFVKAWENPQRTSLYYNMEFVDAPGLHGWLRQRHLQVDETVKLGTFLVNACMHLLRHDLVHGDIKPENILVGTAYDSLFFKLVDLGSCCEVFSHHSRAGTASYLAPERFKNAPVSERSELFSIGVTLYQALTGHLPFGEIERFQTPAFRDPKPPVKLNPLVPPWLEAVVLRACAIQPERRYQHFSELLHDLANPHKVRPWHAEHTPFIERNPVLFWKLAALLFAATSLALALLLAGR